MSEAQFCSLCGSPLAETLLPTETRSRLVCGHCGYVHYINPKLVCGTLPIQDSKVWLLRRGIEPRFGYWTYPAGFQEIDETAEDGALRETLEELGCEVELGALFGVYSRAGAPVNVVYLARVTDALGFPCPTDEALEVRAFASDEIPWQDLAFISTHSVLQDWVARSA